MILRNFYWTLLLSLPLLITVTAQNARSYDENDWIPITPSKPSENTKKAQGRVLNLEVPNQNYFPQNEYVEKRQPQLYLQENSFQKGPNVRHPKNEHPYKFEPVETLQPPQYTQQNQFVQQPQVQPQFVQNVQQLPYVQTLQQVQQVPPVQQPVLNQQLVAPAQTNQNFYDPARQQQQIQQQQLYLQQQPQYSGNVLNNTFQPGNVGALNLELLGAIQNQNVNQIQLTTTTTKPKEDKETVQLLYVPLENLKASQPVTQAPRAPKRTELPRREKQISRVQNYRPNQVTNIGNIQNDFITQALAAHKLQQQFQLGETIELQTTTTPRPKKRKANQPPLAVYMEKEGSADVKDVLEVLKHARSISVQDSAGPDSPKIFVGPSSIDPEGYAKFPLPYLSSVQGNRIERKVENLPFFVAPLSYKAPEGYSKIPLPSPHVGSVVVATKEELHNKDTELKLSQTAQNQIVQDFDIKQPFDQSRDEPKPNPYLLNQNPQNSLFGFGNQFFGGLPNTVTQNYQVTPSKEYNDYQENTKEDTESQNYEDTPSRDYNQNYQLDLKDNSNQYYDSTPSYKPRERTNVRGNYRVPDYQNEEREAPNQNTKELVRDYDIPSVPVESTPKYQIQQRPQVSQYPSSVYSTPRTPASVYSLTEEPVIQSTTTTTTVATPIITHNRFKLEEIPQQQYRVPQYRSRGTAQQDPLRQVINQYEIEQINSQLGNRKEENVETVRSTTPAVVSTQKYKDYDAPTTSRSRSRSRQRGRKTTTSTTPNAIPEENYTVLEEFNIQPKTSTVKYSTEVETIPAKVYKLESEQPVFVQNQAPQKQQVSNEETFNQQNVQSNVPSRSNPNYGQQYLSVDTPSQQNADFNQQFIPGKSPSVPNSNYNQQYFQASTPSRPNTNINEQYLQAQTPSRPSTDYNDEFVQTNTPSRPTTNFNEQFSAKPQTRPTVDYSQQFIPTQQPYRSTADFNQQYVPVNTPSRPTVDFTHELLTGNIPSKQADVEVERPTTEIPESRSTPRVTNSENEESEDEEQVSGVSPYLPGLINNLQDPAVRHLLLPNLLVPTTEKLTTLAPRTTTEEVRVITTEAPRVETTTQRRSRGRQRAQTRYNTNTSTSAPRRNVNRRRPVYTRPTTERQSLSTSTESTVNYEPTRRGTSQRQRFRTRGRPVKEQTVTERVVPTTESVFKQPSLEGGFQASSGDPQSYMQYDQIINNQQIITIKPDQSNEEAPLKEYHQVYSLPAQSPQNERVSEEIVTTSKPSVFDIKIHHPVTDRSQEPLVISTPSADSRYFRVNSNIQSGGVIHNNKNEEAAKPSRTRGRSRTRARFSSTTPRAVVTTTTTTEKPQVEEEDDEFYGFIRKPNFNKPEPIVLTTTQQPLPVYSSHYQQPQRTLIRFEDDGVPDQSQTYQSATSPAPVQFVGQIRPKYTTETQEPSTEAPKVKSRARIRIPARKTTTHQQQAYNEVKPQKYDDQVTRRSSVVRTRTRGKSHYKVPENLKPKTDDQDVEGGNYPVPYLKNREVTTEKASAFQITIDPAEEEVADDQETHPSLYSPQIVRNGDTQWVEASVLPAKNDIEIEDKQMFVTNSEELTTIPVEIGEEEVTTESTEEVPTTTEVVETTTQKRRRRVGGKRRGVWKLVKHKPVDSFETAESQNYYSVLNGFENIEKKNNDKTPGAKTTTTTGSSPRTRPPTTTTTEKSIFDTIYSMLGLASKASQLPDTRTKVVVNKEEATTTTASPMFPEEYTEEITTQGKEEEEDKCNEGTAIPQTTTLPPTTTTTESAKKLEVEPWQVHEIKTSTTTEVSHETEICFKGKCVKSKDEETRL